MIPLVSILLKNKTTEVIVSLVDNLEPLFKTIGEVLLIEKLIPAIINLASDKTWRIRLAVLNFIPKMASFVSKETFTQKIEQTLVQMLTDPVFTIREETANACVTLSKSVFDRQWLAGLVDRKVDELGDSERFMIRIQTVHFMSRMHSEIDDELLNTKFTTTLFKLM